MIVFNSSSLQLLSNKFSSVTLPSFKKLYFFELQLLSDETFLSSLAFIVGYPMLWNVSTKIFVTKKRDVKIRRNAKHTNFWFRETFYERFLLFLAIGLLLSSLNRHGILGLDDFFNFNGRMKGSLVSIVAILMFSRSFLRNVRNNRQWITVVCWY